MAKNCRICINGRTILLLFIYLSSFVGDSVAYRPGDIVPMSKMGQYHSSRTVWQDVIGRHCPIFAVNREVLIPIAKPTGYTGADPYKISFQVGREKFLIPWLLVINRKGPEVPMIDVHLRYSGSDLHGVTAKVIDMPHHCENLKFIGFLDLVVEKFGRKLAIWVAELLPSNLILSNFTFYMSLFKGKAHAKAIENFERIIRKKHVTLGYPAGEYHKLGARKIGPLEVLAKINPNAYRLKLPSHIRTSDVFNVKHLIPYHGDSFDEDTTNSGSNSFHPGENDALQQVANSYMTKLDQRKRK
ncbi:hypothetical protein HHK36_018769 [Tetracentron sinense]|uniref:Tf2-1-like SH3-like domain-containing protein n=1 Tax=Tetracentron sinense TaxID=13715 RepID=A0A835D8J7_TETSI|nr:hypothetical protein HHK36_018769 [Tetracentron sinense]